jgi:site-specific recombinase XerD
MPKLLEVVRDVLRTRHYSYRTEQTYTNWIRQYIIFHDKRHPAEMGAPEVTKFLTHLAVDRGVAASTQNQALAALLFLYRNVLKVDLPWLENVERARKSIRLPVVLTRLEVKALLSCLNHQHWL